MLLVLLPVTGLLAFTAFSGVAQWQEASDLRAFHTTTQVSFAHRGLRRRRPGADRRRTGPAAPEHGHPGGRRAAERATDQALERAVDRTAWGDRGRRRRRPRRRRPPTERAARPGHRLAHRPHGGPGLHRHRGRPARQRRGFESGSPTRTSGRAADAHIALSGHRGRRTRARGAGDPAGRTRRATTPRRSWPEPRRTNWTRRGRAPRTNCGQQAETQIRGRAVQRDGRASESARRRSPHPSPRPSTGRRTRAG